MLCNKAGCRYADHCVLFIVMLSAIMLNVLMLNFMVSFKIIVISLVTLDYPT
jgi:hypothetical protein